MWRYLAGAAAALLLVASALFLGRSMAEPGAVSKGQEEALAPGMAFGDLPTPPEASELSREEKRFNRYDRDKNGAVSREEYLSNRQKSYARLDRNGDGVLSFEEYAVKTSAKFVAADKDKTGGLNRTEFSTTRVVRKPSPKCVCVRAAKPASVGPQSEPNEGPPDEEG